MSVRSIAVTTSSAARRLAGRSPGTASDAAMGSQPTSLSVWLTGRSMRFLEATIALTAMATALLLGAGR